MPLTEPQRRHLKKLAHSLKPVVMIGQNGVSPGVLSELDNALDFHELLKIKVNVGDRELRDRTVEEITRASDAQLIQRIGNVAVLYRANPKKKQSLELPKA